MYNIIWSVRVIPTYMESTDCVIIELHVYIANFLYKLHIHSATRTLIIQTLPIHAVVYHMHLQRVGSVSICVVLPTLVRGSWPQPCTTQPSFTTTHASYFDHHSQSSKMLEMLHQMHFD